MKSMAPISLRQTDWLYRRIAVSETSSRSALSTKIQAIQAIRYTDTGDTG